MCCVRTFELRTEMTIDQQKYILRIEAIRLLTSAAVNVLSTLLAHVYILRQSDVLKRLRTNKPERASEKEIQRDRRREPIENDKRGVL